MIEKHSTPKHIELDGFVMVRFDGSKLHIVGTMSETEAQLRLAKLSASERLQTCCLPIDFKLSTSDVRKKLTDAYNVKSAEMEKALKDLIRESN